MAELTIPFPDLPKLDPVHAAAVRDFFPAKILGRTAALLSLVVLVLAFAAMVNAELREGLSVGQLSRLQIVMLIGFPALVVVIQLAVEWRAAQVRKLARILAVKTDAVPQGYFRIGPYVDSDADRAMFHRADRAHEKVLGWLEQSAAMPLYLTGDSGSGKSSLLNAFVLPSLREKGWTVVQTRALQDAVVALKNAVTKLPGARKPKDGDADLYEKIAQAARRAGGKLLLLLDQFEEFLILARDEEKYAFEMLLARLEVEPIGGLRLLLVLRSDYQSALESAALPLPRYGENSQLVGRFVLAAASNFMVQSKLGLDDAALRKLLTSASELDESPGLVRPVTLNVIGHVLSTGFATAPTLEAGALVRKYIEQATSQAAIREIAPPVLERLVTDQGTKQPRSEADLADATGLRPAEIRAVMIGLADAGLARPLEQRNAVWELSHDFVARAVANYLGRRSRAWWRGLAYYSAPALFVFAVATGGALLEFNRLSNAERHAHVSDARNSLYELGWETSLARDKRSYEIKTRGYFPDRDSTNLIISLLPALDLPVSRFSFTGFALPGVDSANEFNRLFELISKLPTFSGLSYLEVDMAGRAAGRFGFASKFQSLRGLSLSLDTDVPEIDRSSFLSLQKLKHLNSLIISGYRLEKIDIPNLPSIKYLTLWGTKGLFGSTDISKLGGLQSLKIYTFVSSRENPDSTIDLAALKLPKGLKDLEIRSDGRPHVSSLDRLPSLQSVKTECGKSHEPDPTEIALLAQSRAAYHFLPIKFTCSIF